MGKSTGAIDALKPAWVGCADNFCDNIRRNGCFAFQLKSGLRAIASQDGNFVGIKAYARPGVAE